MRAAVMAICVVMGTPAAIGGHASGSMPFEQGAQGGVILDVRIDGKGPFRFLLDTGSTHSAITERLARYLKAAAVAKAVVDSSLGGDTVPVVRLERLEVGPVATSGVMPSVVPAVDPSGEADGILGQDVLASHRYTIDFRARRIDWRGAPVPGGHLRSIFALEPRDGRFLVTLPQRTATLRLVPDSGAATLLFFQGSGRVPAMTTRGRGELTTLTARQEVALLSLRELRVGAIVIRDVPAVLVAMPRDQRGAAGRPDGLLPLHLFDRVTFDGPGRLLVVEKRA
jgi:hypothetical protein